VSEVAYLDREDLLLLTRRLGVGPVHDVGLLDAACARSRSTLFGVDAYPEVEAKAAALLHSLVRNHALAGGNERLAWSEAVVFLDLNGRMVEVVDDEGFELIMRASRGELDVGVIGEALRRSGRAG
jgi:death-on-curing protein